jgi:coproporphyrinogen III oxidase
VSGWFGGGADLTPAYLFDDDAVAFHGHCKAVCDAHEAALGHPQGGGERFSGFAGGRSSLYRDLKARCDAYFMLPARGERRGVGGLFFDDLTGAPGESLGL